MKDESIGKLMAKFAACRPKRYGFLADDNGKSQTTKRHKKVCYITKT